MIKDNIRKCLETGIKTNQEISDFTGKNKRIISATISKNQQLFLRIKKGVIGLKNRDENKITGERINNEKFCLYKKITNITSNKEVSIQQLYQLLPFEKKVSIRATINNYPEIVIRTKRGMIGRKGRDEYLKEKYERIKKYKKETTNKRSLIQKISLELLKKPLSLEELHLRIPGHTKKGISGTLSKQEKFKRIEKNLWMLK